MQPIINPSLFYLIGLCGKLGMTILVLSILMAVVLVFLATHFICIIVYDGYDKDLDTEKNILKKLLIATILGFTISSFIPSETTCYKMVAASMITPDNVEITKDAIVDLIRDISEASIEVKKQAE